MVTAPSESGSIPPHPRDIRLIEDDEICACVLLERIEWERKELLNFGFSDLRQAWVSAMIKSSLEVFAEQVVIPEVWLLEDKSPAGAFLAEHFFLFDIGSASGCPFDTESKRYEIVTKQQITDAVMYNYLLNLPRYYEDILRDCPDRFGKSKAEMDFDIEHKVNPFLDDCISSFKAAVELDFDTRVWPYLINNESLDWSVEDLKHGICWEES